MRTILPDFIDRYKFVITWSEDRIEEMLWKFRLSIDGVKGMPPEEKQQVVEDAWQLWKSRDPSFGGYIATVLVGCGTSPEYFFKG